MGEFYASTVLNEAAKNFPPKGTFEVAGKKIQEPKTKSILPAKSGPDNKGADTLFKVGGKKSAKKGEELSVFSGERFSEENPEFTKKEGKIAKESINNFMTKSIFDKLYETVMNEEGDLPGHDIEAIDAEALDLPTGEEGEVTITIDRELAKKLHDVLMSVLGDEASATEDEGDVEEVDAEDESEETLPEATELKELPASAGEGLTKHSSHKVAGVVSSEVDTKKAVATVKAVVDAKGKPVKKVVGGGTPSVKVAGDASEVGKNLFHK